jgi:hypothetical protein
MMDYTEKPEQKSISELTVDLLLLAKIKGFLFFYEYYDPLEVKSWRHDDLVFCNVVCAAINLWLRTRHKLVVYIEPRGYQQYVCYVQHFKNVFVQEGTISANYEYQLIAGTTHALESLLPVAEAKPGQDND